MTIQTSEKFIAYLALISGLAISVVAEYYSILGLMAIFSAAPMSVVIMGIVLGVGKITATIWLKQNWSIAPWSIRIYLGTAILVLMLVTSMGIFGFLSKAHSDQSLVIGDAQAKLLIYDEKIKTARENIEANRKQLKQMDEAVDQVMARSTTEEGATKANAIRKSQQRDRALLARDIEANQKIIASLNDESTPLRAEVRKVEAEVGPIKYIAAFIYGETDKTLLEKAVTWVIIILIAVFDPLAVILLLASQISFQHFRQRESWDFEKNLEEAADAFNDVFADELATTDKTPEEIMGMKPDAWVADVGEKPTAEELVDDPKEITTSTEVIINEATHPYLYKGDFWKKPEGWVEIGPLVAKPEEPVTQNVVPEKSEELISNVVDIDWDAIPPGQEYITVRGERMSIKAAKDMYGPKHLIVPNYVQNEEQKQSGLWNQVISEQEYRTKAEQNIKNDTSNNTNNTA